MGTGWGVRCLYLAIFLLYLGFVHKSFKNCKNISSGARQCSLMDDSGVSGNVGSILMIFVLVIIAGFMMAYVMDIGGSSIIADYTPQYALVDTDVIPAYSQDGMWNADSIKIKFTAGNELDLTYEEGVYSGTEGIKFMLVDPNGGTHEAMQSITMKGQKITPGATYYFFTVSSGINGQYYITNDYSRIADTTTWGSGWSYPKPFAEGKWRILILDDNLGAIIADKEVVI